MSFAQCRLPDRTVSTLLSDKFKRDCSLEKTAPTTQSLWQEKGQSKAKEAKAKLEAWEMNWEKRCLQIQCIYIYIHTVYICDNIQCLHQFLCIQARQEVLREQGQYTVRVQSTTCIHPRKHHVVRNTSHRVLHWHLQASRRSTNFIDPSWDNTQQSARENDNCKLHAHRQSMKLNDLAEETTWQNITSLTDT